MAFNYKHQKALLTRAINSKDPNKVYAACVNAVKDWNQFDYWPDDWSRWQRALNDAGFFQQLEDL